MSEMLTAKEMQELLHVDRSTIYRMADAGRLPAIKVGKQWRFPADDVDRWLQVQASEAHMESGPGLAAMPNLGQKSDNLARLLPMECVQLIQNTFADLLGVMLVITDMEGNPITKPSRPCGLFEAVSREPDALRRCIQSWHELAETVDLEPQFGRSHLGLMCTRAMIRVGSELKGMVVAGCVAPEGWPPTAEEVAVMADRFLVEPTLLEAHLQEVFYLDHKQQQAVLATMQRIANIVAHIVKERKTLVGRLEAIADLTSL